MSFQQESPELIGQLSPTQYFLDHYSEYEERFLSMAADAGFNRSMWSHDQRVNVRTVHSAMLRGVLPPTIQTNVHITKDTYTGEKVHELVAGDFNKTFPMLDMAFFVITEGQDWWPHERSWLACDADSVMKFFLYCRAKLNPDIFMPKKRGRPAKDGGKVSGPNLRYQQWLKDCEVYRAEHDRLREIYLKASREYTSFRSQGAPKWIP